MLGLPFCPWRQDCWGWDLSRASALKLSAAGGWLSVMVLSIWEHICEQVLRDIDPVDL
jgi:hypothetical protein